MKTVSHKRIRLARIVAIAADCLQLGLFPFFSEGFVSPANVVVDVLVGVILVRLVGWHLAFLPSFVAEGLPVVDLAPTWTIAVLIATRNTKAPVIDVEARRVEPELVAKAK